MSVVEEIGTINIEEIDVSEFISDEVVHLWSTNNLAPIAICGAKDAKHDCPTFFLNHDISKCPTCGAPVCTFCRLLAPGYFK